MPSRAGPRCLWAGELPNSATRPRQSCIWLTCCNSSPHHLAPLDKRFITYSIANAYHELPDVLKELVLIRDRSYSTAVKKYCDEVDNALTDIYNNPDVKALCESVKHYPAMDY